MSDVVINYLEDLKEGQSSSLSKTITDADITLFAGITGDTNPLHIDEEYAKTTIFEGRIAHGMLTAGLLSAVLGTRLPGPGAIYLSQNMTFKAPVRIGDTVHATVTVEEVVVSRKRVRLSCVCRVNDTVVMEGEAQLMVPSRPA